MVEGPSGQTVSILVVLAISDMAFRKVDSDAYFNISRVGVVKMRPDFGRINAFL
jgi:hypothetical protein